MFGFGWKKEKKALQQQLVGLQEDLKNSNLLLADTTRDKLNAQDQLRHIKEEKEELELKFTGYQLEAESAINWASWSHENVMVNEGKSEWSSLYFADIPESHIIEGQKCYYSIFGDVIETRSDVRLYKNGTLDLKIREETIFNLFQNNSNVKILFVAADIDLEKELSNRPADLDRLIIDLKELLDSRDGRAVITFNNEKDDISMIEPLKQYFIELSGHNVTFESDKKTSTLTIQKI